MLSYQEFWSVKKMNSLRMVQDTSTVTEKGPEGYQEEDVAEQLSLETSILVLPGKWPPQFLS